MFELDGLVKSKIGERVPRRVGAGPVVKPVAGERLVRHRDADEAHHKAVFEQQRVAVDDRGHNSPGAIHQTIARVNAGHRRQRHRHRAQYRRMSHLQSGPQEKWRDNAADCGENPVRRATLQAL